MTSTECLIALGLLDVVAFLMFLIYVLCIGLTWLVTWPWRVWKRRQASKIAWESAQRVAGWGLSPVEVFAMGVMAGRKCHKHAGEEECARQDGVLAPQQFDLFQSTP